MKSGVEYSVNIFLAGSCYVTLLVCCKEFVVVFIICDCVRVLIYLRLAGHVARVGIRGIHRGLW